MQVLAVKKSTGWWLCSMVVSVLMLSGCLGKKAEEVRMLWPPPPEQPRMEFVGTYASKEDYPQSRWRNMLEFFLGKTPTETFRAPEDIFVDDSGRVYVSDLGTGNIVKFDFGKKTVDHRFNRVVLEEPLGLAGDRKGNLYIADGKKRKILVFSPEGALLSSFGFGKLLSNPEHLEVNDRSGRLYVSDSLASRIVVFDLQGKHLFSFGQHGENEGEFHNPHGLAIDSENRLFVADTRNARIQVFDADGKFLYQFGQRGNKVWHLMKPRDLAFDSEGHLYILDRGMLALLTYTPDGEVLLATGTGEPSTGPMGLSLPTSIHIDRNDRIYIADQKNRRFSVWQYLCATYLKEHQISATDLQKLKERLADQRKKTAGEEEI